jgi:urease accessory protein
MPTIDDWPPDRRNLLRLLAWSSPAFPIGAFSYSHGLENAVATGLVRDADDLRQWIASLLRQGSAWNDAVLLCEAHRCAVERRDLAEVAELAEALSGSLERHAETMLQGDAFGTSVRVWGETEALSHPAAYCVALGSCAGMHGLDREDAAAAFLQSFAGNMIQAAIRLGVIGQGQGLAILAGLEGTVATTARLAAESSLDDLGSATILSDIAAIRHETQQTRLFRS